jgi:hypothetical protein
MFLRRKLPYNQYILRQKHLMRRLLPGFGTVGIVVLFWSLVLLGQMGPASSGSEAGGHGKHRAKINWKPPAGPRAEEPQSYIIYRTKASIIEKVVNCGEKWHAIATTSAQVTDYIDETVRPGQAYCYAVSTVTSHGESSKSFAASAVIPSP